MYIVQSISLAFEHCARVACVRPRVYIVQSISLAFEHRARVACVRPRVYIVHVCRKKTACREFAWHCKVHACLKLTLEACTMCCVGLRYAKTFN